MSIKKQVPLEKTIFDRIELYLQDQTKNGASPRKYSIKNFVESSVLYFLNSGVDPIENSKKDSLTQEINRIGDRIFGYIRTQEERFIKPVAEQNERLTEYVNRQNEALRILATVATQTRDTAIRNLVLTRLLHTDVFPTIGEMNEKETNEYLKTLFQIYKEDVEKEQEKLDNNGIESIG